MILFSFILFFDGNSTREVQAALRGERAAFTKASRIQLYCTKEEQITVLRSLCDEMEALAHEVVDLGGYVPASPRSVIEMRLLLLLLHNQCFIGGKCMISAMTLSCIPLTLASCVW